MKCLKFSIFATLVALVAFMSTTNAQTADEIIQKHIDAVGGSKNWDKVKTIKLVGGMNMGGQEIGMSQTVANGKGIRMDISFNGQNGYTIVTPNKGWSFMPFMGQTTVQELPTDQLKDEIEKLNVKYFAQADKSFFPKSELLGKDTINKVACYKIKVTEKDGGESTCYFDANTHFLIREEKKVKVQDEEQVMGIDFSNYQKQKEGISIPMTMSPAGQGEITFKSVEINKAIDDKIFAPDTK